MSGRETGGGGVGGEISQPDRTRLGDQQTEDACTVRAVSGSLSGPAGVDGGSGFLPCSVTSRSSATIG
jgi:hypothetical protein